MSKCYLGMRIRNVCHVRVSVDNGPSIPLDPRFDLRNHSPDGFNWGYNGAGPTQLALAILADALGDDRTAELWYMDYRREVLAKIEEDELAIFADCVQAWLLLKLEEGIVKRQF